ncbi:peptidase S41 [Anoxybacter fermentans]|uniref:Peptidase S41 n=1 Tax=Anoxybacter fermentans TaxID=1323375 RepID=A0A3Q9HNZ7_9FIRM|nr:S41 family peptidase [Anoxybacter fermentans]AZR72203.1 peptidase S41 [Anoxybacter fermentans]
MKKKWLIIGNLILLLLISVMVGFYFKSFASELVRIPERFQLLRDIYFIISNFYVDEVDSDRLINAAIRGMVEELDPFSAYLEPEEYEDLQTDLLEGVFGGIGIVITIRDGKLTIISPIKDTPGEAAGLQAGDIILEVDGKSTEGISTDTAVKWMRGEPGTKVILTIKRGDEEPKKYEIIRGLIEVPYIDYELREDKIGYIDIFQFGSGVGQDVQEVMKEFASNGVKGIILDLRNNPGGLLNEAVNVASSFIEKGPIVHIRQRDGVKETLWVNRFIKHYDYPLVVLVNGGSASASEIVAGAIQDTGVGVLVGTRTFGKGTVQNVIPLSDGSAFKITTARYYTPNDRFIHEDGIEPDVVVEFDPEKAKEGIDNQLEKAVELINQMIINKLQKESLKPAS